jgi:hypothetical protein
LITISIILSTLLKSPGLAEEDVEADALVEDAGVELDPEDFLSKNSLNFENLDANDVSVVVEAAEVVPASSSSSSNINSLYFLIM